MTAEEYFGTKRLCKAGQSQVVYLEKAWGFENDDLVDVALYDITDPTRIYRSVKKVCRLGQTTGIFCDKRLGLPLGALVVIKVSKRGHIEKYAGRESEEGDEDLL